MSRLNEQGLRPTYLMPKLTGGRPTISVGDRVVCKSLTGFQPATVIKKRGYCLRVRLDCGTELSANRSDVWLARGATC
jgi:hypothetical protein